MFQFVTVGDPHEPHDHKKQRRIRQHAIRSGIQNKRREEAKRNDNFVTVDIDIRTGRMKQRLVPNNAMVMAKPLSSGVLDPFDSLPGDGRRLQTLMARKTMPAANEPVSRADETGKVFLNGMDDVFRGALSDPSMFHALSLALALAANAGVSNVEFLTHRGATLHDLRQRMSDSRLVPAVSTLTAMLMIIGYEYRVDGGNNNSISMHLGAMKNVLDQTATHNNVEVPDAMRKALFWQDLYSCLFVGTTRLLSHHQYEEYNCESFFSSAPGYFVPRGFTKVISKFPDDFVKILMDLNVLCTIVDMRNPLGEIQIDERPIDNFQYCIESRLVDLISHNRNSGSEDSILQACTFAFFLITYKLSTGIWEGCFISEYCATQIRTLLSKTKNDPRWDAHGFKELHLWLLFISGALAKRKQVRLRAARMIQNDCYGLLSGIIDDWNSLERLCKSFVWSSHSMDQKLWQFWQETRSPQERIIRLEEEETFVMHPA